MFTSNFYKTLSGLMFNDNINTNAVTPQVVDYQGNAQYVNTNPASGTYNALIFGYGSTSYTSLNNVNKAYSNSMVGVALGDGDAPATLSDYKLSGNILSTFSYSCSVVRETDEDGSSLSNCITITNTGSDDMTIKEVGLFSHCNAYRTAPGGAVTGKPCLIERTVFDSPITIPAGGVGQVTYTIRMNYPTA